MYEKGLMMKEIVQKVKGTRDFYPEDMILHHWLGEQIRAVSELFGYQAYEGPYLEKLELYAAKSGEELVKEQYINQSFLVLLNIFSTKIGRAHV